MKQEKVGRTQKATWAVSLEADLLSSEMWESNPLDLDVWQSGCSDAK